MPIEQELLRAALLKWQLNEGQTIQDYRRILNFLNTIPLRLEAVTVDQQQALQVELRQILRARYIDIPSE